MPVESFMHNSKILAWKQANNRTPKYAHRKKRLFCAYFERPNCTHLMFIECKRRIPPHYPAAEFMEI